MANKKQDLRLSSLEGDPGVNRGWDGQSPGLLQCRDAKIQTEAGAGVKGLRTKRPGDPSWAQLAKRSRAGPLASNSPVSSFSSYVSLSSLPTSPCLEFLICKVGMTITVSLK